MVAAALLVVVAGIVIVETLDYPPSLVPGSPGPALVPRVLAVVLGILALVIGLRAWRVRGDWLANRGVKSWPRVGLTVASLGLFLWAMTLGDFFLLLPVLLGALMRVMGERDWKTIVVVSLLFDLFVYLVFYHAFDVRLPTVLF